MNTWWDGWWRGAKSYNHTTLVVRKCKGEDGTVDVIDEYFSAWYMGPMRYW